MIPRGVSETRGGAQERPWSCSKQFPRHPVVDSLKLYRKKVTGAWSWRHVQEAVNRRTDGWFFHSPSCHVHDGPFDLRGRLIWPSAVMANMDWALRAIATAINAPRHCGSFMFSNCSSWSRKFNSHEPNKENQASSQLISRLPPTMNTFSLSRQICFLIIYEVVYPSIFLHIEWIDAYELFSLWLIPMCRVQQFAL